MRHVTPSMERAMFALNFLEQLEPKWLRTLSTVHETSVDVYFVTVMNGFTTDMQQLRRHGSWPVNKRIEHGAFGDKPFVL